MALALVWALGHERRRPAVAVALALTAVAAVLALKGVAMIATGLRVPFGVMHVLWLDLVIVVPLMGVCLLVLGRQRLPRAILALVAVLMLPLAPIGAYASFVEPERLTTERATLAVSPDREGKAPLRIAVLADLQFERVGRHEREAVRRAMRERPDVILMAGDYHQGPRRSLNRQLPAIRALLGSLSAPGGVYAVQGDCDLIPETRRITAGTRVKVLVNRALTARVRDRTVTIAGVELAYRSPGARAAARRLERASGKDDVRILLAHRPDVVFGLAPQTRVDLTVAGHTHGGQVQLPLVGPLTIGSRVPRAAGAGGMHSLDGRSLYVSRGIGVERNQAPKLRLGAVPEVSLITLR